VNKLYFGDNLHILREHIKDEAVDLIYLDPLAWVGPHHRCSPRPTSKREAAAARSDAVPAAQGGVRLGGRNPGAGEHKKNLKS
jgi:hypothetical protein